MSAPPAGAGQAGAYLEERERQLRHVERRIGESHTEARELPGLFIAQLALVREIRRARIVAITKRGD